MMGGLIYQRLHLADTERAAVLEQLRRLYVELHEQGDDVEVGAVATAGGDEVVVAFHGPLAPA